MRVPHFASTSLAALAVAALAAGCGGGDSNAPDAPFDAAGTTSDLGAMEASFESPAMQGYVSASQAISAVLGESPAAAAVKAAPTKALILGDRQGSGQYAAALAKASVRPAGGIRPSLSTAAILDEHLGVTFVYNPETDQYEASDAAGAPAAGVRFIIYAVDPVTRVPVEPLVEVGYADIVSTASASGGTARIEVVSGGVTYLDYTMGYTGNTSAATINVTGFVTNGDDRVNFDLDNHFDFGSESLVLDYSLTVPTRGGFRIDFEAEMSLGTGTVTTALEARGPHGTVTIAGTQSATAGSFEVEVNGALFATITMPDGGAPVFAGADGQPLTQAELDALAALLGIFADGFTFFADLLGPIGALG